ncbi:unnamed protein product [Mycena citricolor]|uniref:DUF6534 domain-containing protein n=1 Tax=Mycena citricolor TaxID=2018698 RepID=A0AAD2GYD2_9AGAR|nr:unnamed protein product [Mycena citricolor]
MPFDSPFLPPNFISSTVAPPILGFMISAPLYGILLAQAGHYFRTFPDDSTRVKLVVGSLVIIDTVHVVILLSSYNQWYIQESFQLVLPKSFSFTPLITYIIVAICQITYAARIWIVSKKNLWITGTVLSLALGQFASGCVAGLEVYLNGRPLVVHQSKLFIVAEKIELSTSFACDMAIMAGMVYFLKDSLSGGTGRTFTATAQIVNRILVYVIGTGSLTSIATAVNLALWLTMPSNFYFLIIHLVLSKLYTNSLLVMLNSRAKFRRVTQQDVIELGTIPQGD